MKNTSPFNRGGPRHGAKPSIGLLPTRYTVTMPDGKTIPFELEELNTRESIEATVVDRFNIRSASELSRSMVSDIMPEIITGLQQDPCKARRLADGTISFLDGSRRRMSAIYGLEDGWENPKLLVWVTKEELTPKQCKYIVVQSEQRKQFSLYDWGEHFSMRRSELSGDELISITELAEIEGEERSLVDRCIAAFAVPKVMRDIVADVVMSNNSWKRLIVITNKLLVAEVVLESFVLSIDKDKVKNCESSSKIIDEIERCQRIALRDHKKQKVAKSSFTAPEPEVFWQGKKNADKVEWKQTSQAKASLSIANIPEDKVEEIRQALKDKIEEILSS